MYFLDGCAIGGCDSNGLGWIIAGSIILAAIIAFVIIKIVKKRKDR